MCMHHCTHSASVEAASSTGICKCKLISLVCSRAAAASQYLQAVYGRYALDITVENGRDVGLHAL